MTDRPITFSAPMVRALLDGRKTQTRRLLNLRKYRGMSEFGPSDTPGYDWHFRRNDGAWCDVTDCRLSELLPYQVGDRIYVREHWKTSATLDPFAPRDMKSDVSVLTLADNAVHTKAFRPPWGRHRQGMHMPRWASRLTLTVTDVRVQRAQEISENDAQAEGLSRWQIGTETSWNFHEGPCVTWPTAREAFSELWNSLHAEQGHRWEGNPWIYALTFTVEKGNIDA